MARRGLTNRGVAGLAACSHGAIGPVARRGFAWRHVLWISLLLTASPHAADWPQLLGPARDGAVAAPAGKKLVEPAVVWDRELGSGFSGPVVAAGKVIIAHRVGDDLTVDAIDAATGVLFWTFKRPTDYVDSFGFDNGPRGVPAAAGGRIFIHGADGVLDALDLDSGGALWSVDTVAELGSPQGFFGRACSPLVMADRVIITPGGQKDGKPAGVAAFDAATGKLLWHGVEDEAGYASPIAVNDDEILCWLRNEVWLIAAATGEVKARRPLRSRMDASVNAAQPVLLDAGRVLLSAGYGVGLHEFKLPGLDPEWDRENLLDCHYGTPVRKDSLVFGFDGRQEMGQTLRCIDLASRETRWQSGAVPGGTLIRVGDHLLAVTEQGELWIVEAEGAAFNALHEVQILRAGHRAHLAFSDGLLFARDGRQLVAVKVYEPR